MLSKNGQERHGHEEIVSRQSPAALFHDMYPSELTVATQSGVQRVISMNYDRQEMSYPSLENAMVEIEAELPSMLEEKDKWSDVVIDAAPTLHRLYREYSRKYRICLHRMDPAPEKGLPVMHYHQWPSLVRVIKNGYKQALAYGAKGNVTPNVCAVLDMKPGATYEMVDENLWHATIPGDKPSYSVMLAEKGTWKTPLQITDFTLSMSFPRVPEEIRDDIFNVMQQYYPKK